MADSTVIIGSLNDKELKESINALVNHVEQSTQKMAKSFDATIDNMKKKLQELGIAKVDMGGGTDGGSTRRTSAVQKETQARKELVTTLDQQAKAEKEAYTPNKAEESYYAIVKKMRENVALLAMEIKNMPSWSLDRQFTAYMQYERQIEQVRQKIAELRQQLNELGKDPNPNRLIIKQTLEEIQAQQQKIVSLEREQVQVTNQIAATDKQAIAQKQAQYERERQALIEMSAGENERARFAKQQAESEILKTEELRKQAQLIRESKGWKENGFAIVNGNTYYDTERMNATAQKKKEIGTLEEQILRNIRQQNEEASRMAQAQNAAIANAKRLEASTKETADNMRAYFAATGKSEAYLGKFYTADSDKKLVLKYLYAENDERARGLTIEQQIQNIYAEHEAAVNRITQMRKELNRQGSKASGINEASQFYERLAQTLNVPTADIKNTGTTIKSMAVYVKQLQDAWDRLSQSDRNSTFGERIRTELQATKKDLQQLRKEAERPISFEFIKNMPTKTLDDIAYKIRQLRSYKMGIDITKPNAAVEINKVDTALRQLQTEMDKYMAKGRQINEINNALGRSWNYMKNRLAFYFTVGASTQFVKQLIDIRGQYELLERSIGILIDSAQNGSQIFAELNSTAIKSPFTTMELGAAAKQLVAYDVAAKDVVDTTRRLADMAAAVGIPIERLTYALGQIKAYGYLNARDARMFANAGIPLVKQLADRYTELEGRLVSTSDVYDRIKKKAISYEDVMETVNKMTDEGGKFFNFQEKAADALKVRIANMTLAWNNMLNEMGKDNQGILSGALVETKKIFENWRNINNMLLSVISVFGLMKAAQLTILLLTSKTLTATRAFVILQTVLGKKIAVNLAAMGTGFMKFVLNPMNLAAAAVAAFGVALGKAIADYSDLKAANQNFNKSIADAANENINSIDKFFSEYKEHFAELGSANKSDQQKLWERIQEEIEKTTKNAEQFINTLNSIPNTVEKINFGKKILTQTQEIEKEAKRLAELDLFNIGGGFADDSLAKNLQQTTKSINELIKKYGSLRDAEQKIGTATYTSDWNTYLQSVKETEKELENFTAQLDKANIGKIMGDDPLMQLANIREFANIIRDNFLATEEGQKITAEGQARLNDSLDKWIAKQAVANNVIKDANVAAIESNRTAWETFFNQLSRSDKERLDYLVETNQTGSDDFRELWDKATNEMAENATTSYNLIQDQIAKLRDTPDIVINVVYKQIMGEEEELDPQRKAYKDKYLKPQGEYIKSQEEYFKERDRLTRKYGRFIKKEGEDNVEWEKRLGEEYQANKKSLASLTAQTKKSANMSEVDKKAKLEEIQALKDENEVLNELRKNQGFDYDQFEKGKNKGRKGGKKKDLVLEALKQEISLVEKLQGDYDKLAKSGASQADALATIRGAYGKTIDLLNTKLKGFGLQTLDLSIITGKDPNKALKHFQDTLDNLVSKGLLNLERSKEVEAVIEKFTLSAKTYNLDKITKGLNNELGKLKEEYELAVELDANPELGGMFMEMFGIDTDALPRTFGEAFDRANKIAMMALSQLNADIGGFDLMNTLITGDASGKWRGFEKDSEIVKSLQTWQNNFRDMFKKNITETEKMLDDYVKKYGDFSDKVAEIEADRLERLKKLNEAYFTEEMRKRPDYIAKLNAIEQGAQREKGQAAFEEFKNSRLYIAMFENLEYVSKATLETMRDKLIQLRSEMSNLSPEQLKQVTQQYEKIEQALIKKNPFKNLTANFNEYMKAVGKEGKQAQKDFKVAQQRYDWQLRIVTQLKEELKQLQKNNPEAERAIEILIEKIAKEDEILAKLKEELGIAEELNEKYNFMRRIFGEQANAIAKTAQTIATNFQSLSDLRDTLHDVFGVELGNELDAIIDDFAMMGEGINQVVSSAQGGDVVGVVSGTIKTIGGIGDAVASVFGDGAARTRRINKEINRSKEIVENLNMAYKDLERAVQKSLGTAETEARHAAIANKQAELAEIERQLALEQSKRKKDRDDDSIRDYKETIQSLRHEIEDLTEEVVTNLTGDDVKSAAEAFVDAWVQAWKAGETTLDAVEEKMDSIIENIIKKAASAAIVGKLISPLYDAIDQYTNENSIGGEELTTTELQALAALASKLSVQINDALGAFYGNLQTLGIMSQTIGNHDLSALQQGIQGITEDTAGALEAITNGISQQSYLQSDLLTQIRDTILGFDLDVQMGVLSEILLQLQSSYQTQMSIRDTLQGWSNASGMAVRVEMV